MRLLLAACGSEPPSPSFVEKSEGIITLTLDKYAADDDSFDMDQLMGEDAESADAVAYSGDFAETGEAMGTAEAGEAMDAADGDTKGKKARGKTKNTTVATNTDTSPSADAMPVTNTVDSGSSSTNTPDSGNSRGSTGSTPDSSFDKKAECPVGFHFFIFTYD